MAGINAHQETNNIHGSGYGAGLQNAAKTARDKSSVDIAIDQLAAEISAAEMNFQSLGDKLKPVRSSGADSKTDGKPTPGPNCELEERVLQLAHRVSALSGSIWGVTSQVCL